MPTRALLALTAAVLAACGSTAAERPPTSPSPTASASFPAASPSVAPTPSTPPTAPPTASPNPSPTATPTPAPRPGTFVGTIGAAGGADVRRGPGTDMAVVGHHPFGSSETFDGWYARGDDPPVPDYLYGRLETWSQDWFRLADGSGWIHSSYVKGMQPAGMAPVNWSAPAPRNVPIPAAGARRIVISITRQHLWAFAGSTVVVDTQIATGQEVLPTLRGTFQVFSKRAPYYFVSPWPPGSPYWYASAWVKYAMEFIDGGYFIHDAPWRSRWGPGANLVAGSHGCVNVPLGAMTRLYAWTTMGTEVVVQSP